MSPCGPNSIEAAVASILNDHFENAENPHETIYRIWLLMSARELSLSPVDAGAASVSSCRARNALN